MLKRLIIFLLFVQISYGQTKEGIEICLKVQEYVNSFITDKEAENALDKILSVIGASKNFNLQSCDEINNALAITYKGNRYILYDKKFMKLISDYTSNWSNLFILAHEVGHHINGHTRDAALVDILNNTTLEKQRTEELEADKFAGFVLAKLGASKNQTLASVDIVGYEGDDRYSTHPNKNKRIEAILEGYNNGITYRNEETQLSKQIFNDTYFTWNKNVETKESPFDKPLSEAYTIGQIKPINNSNMNIKPIFKIEKRDGNINMIIENMGNYSVELTKGNLNYYDNNAPIKGMENMTIVEKTSYRPTHCNGVHKIKIDGVQIKNLNNNLKDDEYFRPYDLEKLVWSKIKINEDRKAFATIIIKLEVMIDEKLYEIDYETYSDRETISLNNGMAQFDKIKIKSNWIGQNRYGIEFLKSLKSGKKLFVRMNKIYVREFFDLESRYKMKLSGHNKKFTNFHTYLFWNIDVPETNYIEFSLKGSSKALDFIEALY